MQLPPFTKLDNPVWYALSEKHQGFAVGNSHVKFYHPDHGPFGALEKKFDSTEAIDGYARFSDNFFIVGEKPVISTALLLKNELVCDQMIVRDRIQLEQSEIITELSSEHANALYNIVNLVQPGYFKHNTRLLGDYAGIFKNEELVAVTGERMKLNDFTEVSAVITHPGHTGKGYARQLVAHTVNRILDQGHLPFLHVAENNYPAIKLYAQLGFRLRRKISFWHISV